MAERRTATILAIDVVGYSRMMQSDAAGGILLSRTVADLAGSDLPCRLRHEGTHSFKNIANPIETLSVDLSDEEVAAARTRMAKSQEVRFCQTKDNLRLAWTTAGSGPPIVKAQNWISHIELDWRDPSTAHIFESAGCTIPACLFRCSWERVIRLGNEKYFVRIDGR